MGVEGDGSIQEPVGEDIKGIREPYFHFFEKGQKGEKGQPGYQGQKGRPGDSGSVIYPPDAEDGDDGDDGDKGVKGSQGQKGLPGSIGPSYESLFKIDVATIIKPKQLDESLIQVKKEFLSKNQQQKELIFRSGEHLVIRQGRIVDWIDSSGNKLISNKIALHLEPKGGHGAPIDEPKGIDPSGEL